MLNQNNISLFANTLNNGLNFVEIELKSTTGNKFAIGARIYIYSGSQTFLREVACGQDESVQFPYRQHFGLSSEQKIDSVVILWPLKPQKRELFTGLEINMIHKLTEGGGVKSIPVNVAEEKKLAIITDAFPNPFSQFSVISYTLTESANVKLIIFDGEGKEITALINEWQEAGSHEAVFNANDLPQGSYYYILTTGEISESKKLILIK